jgi:hypothetical protein
MSNAEARKENKQKKDVDLSSLLKFVIEIISLKAS